MIGAVDAQPDRLIVWLGPQPQLGRPRVGLKVGVQYCILWSISTRMTTQSKAQEPSTPLLRPSERLDVGPFEPPQFLY